MNFCLLWKHGTLEKIAVSFVLFTTLIETTATAQSLKFDSETTPDPRRANGSARVTQEIHPSDSDNGSNDKERTAESYQPKGIPVGRFIFFPLAEAEMSFNDNIYGAKSNRKPDLILKTAPELRLRSQFSEHALNITARVEDFVYKTHQSENHIDASFNADARYDLERNWEATGVLGINQAYEDRGSPDDAGGKRPTLTRSVSTRVGSKKTDGRMTYIGDFSINRRVFHDVQTSDNRTINNSDRNRTEVDANLGTSYEMFPGYSAVVEASANSRTYDDRRDDQGFERSSKGYAVRSGVGIDLSQLIRGDFTVGYMAQDYQDSRFTDPQGLSLRASFNWTPSKLTVVVPSIERSIQETTSANNSAIVRTGFNLLVRHEWQRNIVLTATARVANDSYKGSNQSDWNYEARFRGIWALAPEYYTSAEVGTRMRQSNVASSEFIQTVGLLRFGVRL